MRCIYMPQMIKTLARQASGVGYKGQQTVKQYAEEHSFSGDHDVDTPKHNRLELKLKDSWCSVQIQMH